MRLSLDARGRSSSVSAVQRIETMTKKQIHRDVQEVLREAQKDNPDIKHIGVLLNNLSLRISLG